MESSGIGGIEAPRSSAQGDEQIGHEGFNDVPGKKENLKICKEFFLQGQRVVLKFDRIT